MNFLAFKEFINESDRKSVRKKSPMTPTLRKSLDRIGKSFKSDKEIVNAIELLGFSRESVKPNSGSAEYIFVYSKDPVTGEAYKYITYSSGYVRAIMPKGSWGRSMATDTTPNMAPISNQYIPTTRDRLLLVLRRALKKSELYKMWIKTDLTSEDPIAEFFEKKRGTLLGKKYGL
jgi:hypothetical protein